MALRFPGVLSCDNEGCKSEQQVVIELIHTVIGLTADVRFDRTSGLAWKVNGRIAACSPACEEAIQKKSKT